MTPSIRIEGGLFSSDLLEQLDRNDLPGQRAADFGLSGSLSDEVAAVFSEARALWDMFQQRLQRLGDQSSPAQITRVTRNQWHIPFFSLLGYDLQPNAEPLLIGNVAFPISHRAGPNPDAPPVHLVAKTQVLGAIDQTTRPRRSPHALLQQYLNQSDALWGIVTNGAVVRLLRNSTLISRQSYLEIDLEAIFTDNRFDDFFRAYRLLHRSRLPQGHADAERCLLEQYYRTALEQGGRVRERLREGVEQAISTLADGFLATGYQPPDAFQFYRDLLRLVYRILFLLVAEQRGLFGETDLYRDHYSISRLVRLSSERNAYTDDVDLWHSVRALWYVLRDEKLAEKLGVAPLNGDLFTELPLDHCRLRNRDLLSAIWRLAWYRPTEREQPRRVNYAALDTEELGSVYESLLDYHPVITGGTFTLSLGSERKTTGSYYTPPQLVQELVTSTLKPVLAERLQAARTQEAKIAALLNLKVLDPACGSGHFLLAAARYLGRELARLRFQEDEPSPDAVRQSVRDVITHCIYGVDKNPLAVELARVALWIESHDSEKPLTFLDHRIKCGDSLVGILNLNVLKTGIPDDTFAPLSTDDKEIANSLKKRNRSECRSLASGQMRLPFAPAQVVAALGSKHHDIEAIADDSPAAVREKKNRYERLLADPKRLRLIEACDLWTAAFFQRFTPELLKSHAAITTDVVTDHLAELAHPQALAAAQALAVENRFFHWPLEFPEVFHPSPHRRGGESTPPSPKALGEGGWGGEVPPPSPKALGEGGWGGEGGFDVILGNPPWERIKLQEEEFFASRNTAIARAPNAAARKRLIADLPKTNPALWHDYQRALHGAESTSRFLRGSGQYPLTGRGDINTYSVFAERVRSLLNIRGRAGIIVPTGIATDATNQFFFADLVEKGQLASLFDFENRDKLFPAVDSRMKFCLLTLTGRNVSASAPAFAFFATRTEHLHDSRRVFSLTAEDIARINPNTRTLPVFRTRQDAELTRAIYERVPVLVNENSPPSPKALGEGGRGGEGNPWDVRFMAMFHMSNDSHLFRTRAELEKQGYRLVGNVFVPSPPSPLSHAAGEGGRIAAPDLSSRAAGEGEYKLPRASRELIARARQLRREATTAESLLWELLRDCRLLGRKFRRQHPIGQFIADFFCDDARLIIEIDGAVHHEPTQQERDRLREEILREHGFAMLRFTNEQIFNHTEQVLQEIAAYVTAHSYEHPSPHPPSPSPQAWGEGEKGGEGLYLPLYEAKMIWHYDHRYGTYEGVRDRSSTQLPTPDEHQHADPHFVVQPWYWVPAEEVTKRLGDWQRGWLVGFRDVTNATNERTAIFSLLPRVGVGHTMPIVLTGEISAIHLSCFLANLNVLIFDWALRQKIGGTHLTFFILRQLPIFPPTAYTPADLAFIVPRVLELTYTAWDMKPFADDVWNEADDGLRAAIAPPSPQAWGEGGWGGEGHPPSPAARERGPGGEGLPFPPFRWDEDRRAILRAELDAYYARLYGLTRKQLRYILDPADLTERELENILDPWEEVSDPLDPAGYAERVAASTFPGETFRVLKEKEMRQFGEYRTRRLVLEAWERLSRAR